MIKKDLENCENCRKYKHQRDRFYDALLAYLEKDLSVWQNRLKNILEPKEAFTIEDKKKYYQKKIDDALFHISQIKKAKELTEREG